MLGAQISKVKLIKFLKKSIADDVRIDIKRTEGYDMWLNDRYMRTCTVDTGIQELHHYRQNHDEFIIRLVAEDGTKLIIHDPSRELEWC